MNKKLFFTLIGITLLLSLTPFYSMAYIILILLSLPYLQFLKTFDSLISRFLLGLLILAAIIMTVGVVTWFMQLPLLPPVIVILYGAVTFLFSHWINTGTTIPALRRSDLIAIASSFTAILFTCLFFYLPPSSSSSIQIITNGYDNTAHLTLLQTSSKEQGYVYGYKDQVSPKTISDLGSYPQGWHLATAHIFDGFSRPFYQLTPITMINAYLIILAIWYLLALFTACKLIISLIHALKLSVTTFPEILTFAILCLLGQLMVYWGSLQFGFASFLGTLVFINLTIIALIDSNKKTLLPSLLLACLACVSVAQTWILPIPAVLLVAFAILLFHQKSIRNISISSILIYVATTLFSIFPIWIIVHFSSKSSSDQLVNDGGIFSVSGLLLAILVGVTLLFWYRKDTANPFYKVVTSVLPFYIIAGALYVYQVVLTGKTTYYSTKTLAVATAAAFLFFTPALYAICVKLYKKTKLPAATAPVIAVAIFLIGIIGSGQSVNVVRGLMQRNSIVSTEKAEAITYYLRNYDVKNTQLVLLSNTEAISTDDIMGAYLANRTAHDPTQCAWRTGMYVGQPYTESLKELKICSQNAKHIVVLTSNATNTSIRDLQLSNVTTLPLL